MIDVPSELEIEHLPNKELVSFYTYWVKKVSF